MARQAGRSHLQSSGWLYNHAYVEHPHIQEWDVSQLIQGRFGHACPKSCMLVHFWMWILESMDRQQSTVVIGGE